MRTIPIGEPPPRQRRDAQGRRSRRCEACKAALKPGRPIGEVFDAYARVSMPPATAPTG